MQRCSRCFLSCQRSPASARRSACGHRPHRVLSFIHNQTSEQSIDTHHHAAVRSYPLQIRPRPTSTCLCRVPSSIPRRCFRRHCLLLSSIVTSAAALNSAAPLSPWGTLPVLSCLICLQQHQSHQILLARCRPRAQEAPPRRRPHAQDAPPLNVAVLRRSGPFHLSADGPRRAS